MGTIGGKPSNTGEITITGYASKPAMRIADVGAARSAGDTRVIRVNGSIGAMVMIARANYRRAEQKVAKILYGAMPIMCELEIRIC